MSDANGAAPSRRRPVRLVRGNGCGPALYMCGQGTEEEPLAAGWRAARGGGGTTPPHTTAVLGWLWAVETQVVEG